MSRVRSVDGPRRTRAEWYADAKALRDAGLTGAAIARRLGLSQSFVCDLLNDPDGSKARARKDRNRKPCVNCGAPTTPETLKTGLCLACFREQNRAKHGTRSRYRSGCRCDACRHANTVYQRRLVGQPPPTHSVSGYMNYGCRCDICRAAYGNYQWRTDHARYQRERLKRLKQNPDPVGMPAPTGAEALPTTEGTEP